MDMASDIARLRRFNRAVTRQLGVLDTSFLKRGRPLGAARVLNAIGQGQNEVAAIRDYLDLDSGLMSRLLRGLEAEGLIETRPDSGDRRRRYVQLTAKGRKEFAIYESLSNDQATALLALHPDRSKLLSAVDLITAALNTHQTEIIEADPSDDAAKRCLVAYYAELAERFVQGFDVNLSRDPDRTDMLRPRGVFLMAVADGQPLGCVGLKGDGGPTAEIKRLWVDQNARNLGLARRLMNRAEDAARALGISVLRLDTNSALPEAAAFYRKEGWVEIERFNDDPYPDMFFEKRL